MKLSSLAIKNMKKSIKDYLIYFLTLLLAVSIFYIFNAIDSQSVMMQLSQDKRSTFNILVELIGMLSYFIAFVLGFLVIYANNFIIKRRKKEMGLYLTLGMSKFKVSMILVIETILIGLLSLILGIAIGVGLSQFVSILVASLFDADMQKFHFVFSKMSLIKTMICFGVVFLVVMIFNVLTISRLKLIDLLYAKAKNEVMKIRNKYLTGIIFIFAVIMIGYAYYLLNKGALLTMDNDTIMMLLFGAMGTFFLFYTISTCLLTIIQMRKSFYYSGLNMFVLKQVNSSINTHVVSSTIISLMLLLTIGSLTCSLSFANSINQSFEDMYPADFSYTYSEDKNHMAYIQKDAYYLEQVQDDYTYNVYIDEQLTYRSFALIQDARLKELEKTIPIILESDYNHLLKMYGVDKKIDVDKDHYVLIANSPSQSIIDSYNQFLTQNSSITIGNNQLQSQSKHVIKQSVTSDGYEEGIVVVDDSYQNDLVLSSQYCNGVFKSKISEQEAEKFGLFLEKYDMIYTLKDIEFSRFIGMRALMTFVGLYLGIIFAITCGAILAIEQLSAVSDNKERYRILQQLGTDQSMINRSLLVQIGICFMSPLIVGGVHSIFGIHAVNKLIQSQVHLNTSGSSAKTALLIIVVYGGYFWITYMASHRVIHELD